MNFANVLAVVGSTISLISYLFYFASIFKHKTKPSRVAFAIWATSGIVALIVAIETDSGSASLLQVVYAGVDIAILALSFHYGKFIFTKLDGLLMIANLLAIASLLFIGPEISIIFIVMTSFAAASNTVAKQLRFPGSESLASWGLGALGATIVAVSVIMISRNPFSWILVIRSILVSASVFIVGVYQKAHSQKSSARKFLHQNS